MRLTSTATASPSTRCWTLLPGAMHEEGKRRGEDEDEVKEEEHEKVMSQQVDSPAWQGLVHCRHWSEADKDQR
eukprot:749369-Hanusia_phi.AAC.4